MKYINEPSLLSKEFRRLLNAYDNYYWMVAWAGDFFDFTDELSENFDKIKQVVIGLHFFQTHPKFIEHFNNYSGVKFIKDTAGIFHPKVYLFANDNENWELLIGSANFTSAGFNKNNEAVMLLRSDASNEHIYYDVKKSIEEKFSQAKKFKLEELDAYKIAWENQKIKRDSLSGFQNKDFYKIPVVKRTWEEYINKIISLNKDINDRIYLLDVVKKHFTNYPSFESMPIEYRKQVGGYVYKNQPVDFRLFGNMLNATTFTHLINNNPKTISKALDEIPLEGIVTKDHFDSFAELYSTAVNGGNKYRSATRLLAMKRPDIFFGLSNGNNDLLARDFKILSISTINLKRYWEEIILRIYESDWWQNPRPTNETQAKISNYRAAFMDGMYYTEEI